MPIIRQIALLNTAETNRSDSFNSLNQKSISIDHQYVIALILRFQDRKRLTSNQGEVFLCPVQIVTVSPARSGISPIVATTGNGFLNSIIAASAGFIGSSKPDRDSTYYSQLHSAVVAFTN